MSSDSKTDQDAVHSYPHVNRLLWVMQRLRDPDSGCPWDREQDFASIVPYTIEEAYEVADAIEQGDMAQIKDELGDLLFQVVFYAQLGAERDEFDFEAVAEGVADKLIRRHPHVFADLDVADGEALNQQWESIKQQERDQQGHSDDSILAHIPRGMAPLMRAHKLQKKCANVGFDWPEMEPVVDKIHEEIDEVLQATKTMPADHQAVEEEIGDLLFAVVNLSRHLNVDAETALRKANVKFEARFRAIEKRVAADGANLTDLPLEALEAYWQKIKKADE